MEKGASVDDVYWPAHDKWDGLVKALNKGSIEGMDQDIQVSYEWAMMDYPQQYLELGDYIGAPLALLLSIGHHSQSASLLALTSTVYIASTYGTLKMGDYRVFFTALTALYSLFWFFISFLYVLGIYMG